MYNSGGSRSATTDFAFNFGPSYVKLLDGADALTIRYVHAL